MRRQRNVSGLYAILDGESLARQKRDVLSAARALRDAGVALLQYRDKTGDAASLVRTAREIYTIFAGTETTLLLNDRPDLVDACQFHGVHLGQNDVSPDAARRVLGEHALIGLSTHTLSQALSGEEQGSVDYLALGPIFATATKRQLEPVVGLDLLRAVRHQTRKPLVAIGGITPAEIMHVVHAGADAIAMIGGLLTDNMEETARDIIHQIDAARMQTKGPSKTPVCYPAQD